MGKNKADKSIAEKNSKANIQTQNVDTSLAVFKTDDIRSYERKNMPKGSFNKNRGSK